MRDSISIHSSQCLFKNYTTVLIRLVWIDIWFYLHHLYSLSSPCLFKNYTTVLIRHFYSLRDARLAALGVVRWSWKRGHSIIGAADGGPTGKPTQRGSDNWPANRPNVVQTTDRQLTGGLTGGQAGGPTVSTSSSLPSFEPGVVVNLQRL